MTVHLPSLRDSTPIPRPDIEGNKPHGNAVAKFESFLGGGSPAAGTAGLAKSVGTSLLGNFAPMLALQAAAGLSGGGGPQQDPASGGEGPSTSLLEPAKQAADLALSVTPGISTFYNGAKAVKDLAEGNLGGAALNALGAVPLAGTVSKGAEALLKLA